MNNKTVPGEPSSGSTKRARWNATRQPRCSATGRTACPWRPRPPATDTPGVKKNGGVLRRLRVMAADSYLQGILLHELFGQGSEKLPELLEQHLVSPFAPA